MTTMASQITSPTIVYSTVYSDADQRKQFPHKWPVTRKMFPFDDVIMSKRGPWKPGKLVCLLKIPPELGHVKTKHQLVALTNVLNVVRLNVVNSEEQMISRLYSWPKLYLKSEHLLEFCFIR